MKKDSFKFKFMTPYGVSCRGPAVKLADIQTEFQKLEIIDSGAAGKLLILDNSIQSCTSDEFLYHEAIVQPACICHGAPESVLVLGGAEGASVREALKWKTVKKIVMIDIDSEAVAACRRFLPEMSQGAYEDPRVQLVIADAYDYIDRFADAEFDIIISDLTEPAEEGISAKLFTREYFERCRRIMSGTGYFVMHSGPVTPTSLSCFHIRMINTLRAVMGHVVHYLSYIPSFASPWGFVMASPVSMDTMPDPASVDRLLKEKTSGAFRLVDGAAWYGLMSQPKYIREALESDEATFSLNDLPGFKFIESPDEDGFYYSVRK